jgi:hypothetical protein
MIKRSLYGIARWATFADGLGAGTNKFALPNTPGWKDTMLTINPIAQFPAGLEVGSVLLRHLYRLPGLRIAAGARRAVVDPKTAEPTDFDAPAFL